MDKKRREAQPQATCAKSLFLKVFTFVLSIILILVFWSTAFGGLLQAQAVAFSDQGAVNNQYDLRRSLFVDVDGDGDEDLIGYSTWNPRQLRLLINQGDGSFNEETQARGLYLSYSNIHHTTAFDVDNDGDFDLWVGDGENESSSNRLFINDGSGYFSNSGVNFSNGSKGSGAADVDGDGDIDLVDMGNDEQTGGTLYLNNGGSLNPTTNRFDGGRPHGYQGPIFGDYDEDGDPDMFTTANYYGHNHLYRNEGDGTFTDVTDQYNLSFQSECYGADGAAWADFDNDGDLDLLAMEGEKNGSDLRIRIWIRENVNSGQSFVQRYFEDRTESGVDPEYSPDAAMVADFDNDGDLDFWPVGQRDIYYNLLNEGSAFAFSPLASLPIPTDKPSRTAAWADPDNDGDVDLFYAQFIGASGEGEDVLHWYRNNSNAGANWLQVTLTGEQGDAGGYGVRVYVYEAGHVGEAAYLKGMRESNSGVMYHASVSRLLHFGGLDPAKSYDLVIRKPFKRGEFVISNITAGKRISVDVANPGPMPTFVDVPATHWAYEYVEYLYKNGFVSGCSTQPLKYCPENGLTRAEMAVFVERGVRGGSYMPPAATEMNFVDVPLGEWFAKWVKILSDDEYTSGCYTDPPQYCPLWAHTREEAAVFIDRIYYGKDYVPDVPNVPFYEDIPVGSEATWSSKWIWAAYQAELIQDCEDDANRGDNRFRPNDDLTRAEAACILYQIKTSPPPPASPTPTASPLPTEPTPTPTPNTGGGNTNPTAIITLNHDLSEGNGERSSPYVIHSQTVQFRLDDSYDVDGMDQLVNGGTFYARVHSGRFLGCGIEWSETNLSWQEIDDHLYSVDLPGIGFYNLRLTVTDNTGLENEVKIYIYTNVSPIGLGHEPAGNQAPIPMVTFANVISGSGSYADPYMLNGNIAHFHMLDSTDPDGQEDILQGTFHYEIYYTDGTHPVYGTGYTYADMQNHDFTFDMSTGPTSEHFRLVASVIDRWGRHGEITVHFNN